MTRIRTVTNTTALAAIAASDREDGQVVLDENTLSNWEFDASSSASASAIVVVPNAGTGRFKRVLGDVVSVKDFGAVGDGTTDDTTAFAAALAVSRQIFIPAGTYLLDAWTAVTPAAALHMVGEGRGLVTIVGDGTEPFIQPDASVHIEAVTFDTWDEVVDFSAADGASDVEIDIVNVRFVDCVFGVHWPQGEAGNIARALFHRIHWRGLSSGDTNCVNLRPLGGAKNVKFIENDIDRVTKHAMSVGYSSADLAPSLNENIEWRSNQVRNCVGPDDEDVHAIFGVGEGLRAILNDINAVANSGVGDAEAIYFKGLHGLVALNKIVNGGNAQGAIAIKGTARGTGDLGDSYDWIVENNHVIATLSTSVCGVLIAAADVTVRGNRFESIRGPDVKVLQTATTANRFAILDNDSYGNLGDGCIYLSLYGGIFYGRVERNRLMAIAGNGTAARGIYSDIGTSGLGTIEYLNYTNNTIQFTSTSTDRRGFLLLSGGGSTRIVKEIDLRNNIFDNATRAISSASGGIYSRMKIAGLTLLNMSGADIYRPAGAVTVTLLELGKNDSWPTSQRGTATVLDTNAEVTVSFTSMSTTSLTLTPVIQEIVVTPNGDMGALSYFVPAADITNTSFKIKLSGAASGDVAFSWRIDIVSRPA